MPAKKRRKAKKSEGNKAKRGLLRKLWIPGVAVAAAVGAWLLWPFWHLSLTFGEHATVAPTRIYARPLELRAGQPLSVERLEVELATLGYLRRESGAPAPGAFVRRDSRYVVHLRSFPYERGLQRPAVLEVDLSGGWVRSLTRAGKGVRSAELEPPMLATLHGPERKERRPVTLDELPEDVIQAVLAAEDDGFFTHAGLSATGILRAAWRNLQSDGGLQGGSTLTQQLVKNLYLTHERTMARKVQEAVLAVLIELRFEKRDILEAYLNEIYWGQSGGANLMGIGAAARVYYSKDAAQLDLGEAATLAGIIQAPNRYAPDRHPQDAGKRRDWVLGRMKELGWLSEERFEAAMAAPTESRPQRVVVRRAPYFVDRTLRELDERYGDIASQSGLSVLTSLDWHDQQNAESAVAWGMEAIEEGWEKESGTAGDLQAALVSLDPHSGEIVSWVGGRDYQASQFDRASLAKRQAGSAFKPVVYAAAMKNGVVTPATLLEDSPFAVREAGQEVWEPRNDSREFHGWVTVREAVETSLNVPTARVAMETGLDEIVATARQLGITTRLRPYPALALGAFEVTPQELAGVYATLASGGVRWPVHGVRAVISAGGNPLPTPELPQEERVLEPSVAYVLTSVLRGVVDRGTARVVRQQGFHDPLAGKTGTTDGRRDSWFAGYSPSRASLVWVGYDDNRETRLSGSRAALPIWSRFMWKVRPAGGFSDFARPPGVDTATIDPETGLRANLACPEARQEVFLEGQAPWRFCFLHGSGSRRARAEAREAAQETAIGGEVIEKKRSFWQRVFGKKKKKKSGG